MSFTSWNWKFLVNKKMIITTFRSFWYIFFYAINYFSKMSNFTPKLFLITFLLNTRLTVWEIFDLIFLSLLNLLKIVLYFILFYELLELKFKSCNYLARSLTRHKKGLPSKKWIISKISPWCLYKLYFHMLRLLNMFSSSVPVCEISYCAKSLFPP